MCRSSKAGAESVAKVLQREDLGDGRARAFWHALGAVHGSKGLVEEIPNMPCTVTVDADGEEEEDEVMKAGRPQPGCNQDAAPPSTGSFVFQFTGAPRPMLPLLKQMVRFERPFITWDIWNEPAPLAFPATPRTQAQGSSTTQPQGFTAQDQDTLNPPLRDPALVNTVRHLANAETWDKEQNRLDAEAWADTDGGPVEAVKPVRGGLFIVHGDPDGELALGLVHITSSSVEKRDVDAVEKNIPHIRAAWFQRTDSKSFKWSEGPSFKWWPRAKSKRVKEHKADWIRVDCLLLQVKLSDLTEASRKDDVRLVQPRLRKPFMEKLKALAKQRKLLVVEGEEDGGGSGDGGEGGEDGGEEEEEAAMAAVAEKDVEDDDNEEDEEEEEEEEEDEEEPEATNESIVKVTLRRIDGKVGIAVSPDDVITAVHDQGAGLEAGLQIGDVILEVNGKDLRASSFGAELPPDPTAPIMLRLQRLIPVEMAEQQQQSTGSRKRHRN